MYYSNKDKYEGEFKHNKKDGYGKYSYSNGNILNGKYINGKVDGKEYIVEYKI